jgi:hypothetical protein
VLNVAVKLGKVKEETRLPVATLDEAVRVEELLNDARLADAGPTLEL